MEFGWFLHVVREPDVDAVGTQLTQVVIDEPGSRIPVAKVVLGGQHVFISPRRVARPIMRSASPHLGTVSIQLPPASRCRFSMARALAAPIRAHGIRPSQG
jgi:hypothetical protein